MNRKDIDTLWFKALRISIEKDDDFTRYEFAALIEQHLIESGYRKCAGGQRVTQHCAMVEEAVKEEREACARVCEVDVGMLGKGEAGEFWTYMCAKAIRERGKV